MVPQNSQQIQQFLSSVLSQRGPSSLPYTEDVKWLIRQHLLSLIDTYPSLQPKTASFTHNDGRTVNLLQVVGTVPMVFQNVTYNIPVIIWLMESYPRHSPLVFVNPTRDMVIKRAHSFVNPSGVVSIPYLQNWIYPSSNLVELARNLSHFFGRDPPLFASNPNPNPNLNTHPPPSTSFPNHNSIRPAIPPRAFPQLQPPPYERKTEDPAEVFRRNVVDNLVVRLHKDVGVMREAREMDVEGLFNVQGVLKKREEELKLGLEEMKDEKEELEKRLQVVLRNSDELEGWLRVNEAKLSNLGNVDVDVVFEPCNNLSKQMLDCTASDLAIEDVLYSLDKAIQAGAIPFDQYLRNIRLLSREQFFQRATAWKVRADQMQTQVANMAARPSPYAL